MRFALEFGFFTVTAMPNQPSIAWCSDFTIHLNDRGNGKAHELKAFQNEVLRHEGFSFAMYSVKESNKAQIRVLRKAGWRPDVSFTDVRTGEIIQAWTYHVNLRS